MEQNLEQFAELELSKEDHDQIFEPPTDRSQQQEYMSRWERTFYHNLFLKKKKLGMLLPN